MYNLAFVNVNSKTNGTTLVGLQYETIVRFTISIFVSNLSDMSFFFQSSV